jgi:hypothetical protein
VSEDALEGESTFRLQDQYFGYNILARDGELGWYPIVQRNNVGFNRCLVEVVVFDELRAEGTAACTELVDQHSNAPDIHAVVVKMRLIDHLRR